MKKLIFSLLILCHSMVALANPYAFTLQSSSGEVSDADFSDKYLLLTFGYTSCPDICPTTLYEIAKALKLVEQPEKLQVVFISIDPNNDELKRLQEYVHYFDKRILGLSGDYATLKTLTAAYGATFGYKHNNQEVSPPDLPLGYSVYHSTLIYLLSPQTDNTRQRLEVFNSQVKHPTIAKVLNQHLNHH